MPNGYGLMRVVPVESAIKDIPGVNKFDKLSYYINKYDVFSVSPCSCRASRRTLGDGCGHPEEDMCIQMGKGAEHYIRTGRARQITREEVYYLARNVSRVIGVDISMEMSRIAAAKLHDPRVEVVCGDIEAIPVRMPCECCVVYNAFPHFEDPARLIGCLARWVRPGGRLTVAHSMGLDALRRHHAGRAEHVSREMFPPQELAELFIPWFQVDTAMADGEKYVVSGVRIGT